MNSKSDKQAKRTKGDATRQSIIDSAVKLFIENGFSATTTRQITDDLEMTRGIIYNYFESKDEIFVAVINKYHPWLQIISSVKKANGDNLETLVNNARNILSKKWNKNPEMTRLHFIELVEFHGEHLAKLFDRVFNEMIEILTKKVQDKEHLSSMRIATISRALLGLFFAYLMSENFTGINGEYNFNKGIKGIDFDYFSDIYLTGISEQLFSDKKQNGRDENPS